VLEAIQQFDNSNTKIPKSSHLWKLMETAVEKLEDEKDGNEQ
jgi:hypothetical protein